MLVRSEYRTFTLRQPTRWSRRLFSRQPHKLTDFDRYQGKEIESTLDAQTIYGAQMKFVITALETSLKYLSKQQHPHVQYLMTEFDQYMEKVNSGYYLNHPTDFLEEQKKIYFSVHRASIADTDKLAFEFALGLARFNLAIQAIYRFFEQNYVFLEIPGEAIIGFREEIKSRQGEPFFSHLERLAILGRMIIQSLADSIQKKHINYWELTGSFFDSNPDIKNLAQFLVSMQYIPPNPRFLSMAQVLHWNGLGGNAEIIKPFEMLQEMVTHAISYHGNATNLHFSQRLQEFKHIRENLMAYVSKVAASAIQTQFNNQTINMYDICSGPKYSACSSVIELLPDYTFTLTISDVDGGSLRNAYEIKRQHNHPNNLTINQVRYEDLNLNLSEIENDQYHMIMAGIGFHQLPMDRIPIVLNQLSLRVKPGGFILNPDVGFEAMKQIFLIPSNLIDREGFVPAFNELDIEGLIQTINEDYSRITYPLQKLCCKSADALKPDYELGLYTFNLFIVIDIKSNCIGQIINLWNKGNYDACDSFVEEISRIDVCQIQENIKDTLSRSNMPTPRA